MTILDAGRATLELSNPAQVALIDEVEVGRRVSPRLRVAFDVPDADHALRGCRLRRVRWVVPDRSRAGQSALS